MAPPHSSVAWAAGISDRLWSLEEVIAKIDALIPTPKVLGPYKKTSQIDRRMFTMNLNDILRIISTLALIIIAIFSVRIWTAVKVLDVKQASILDCLYNGKHSATDSPCMLSR
jgi:hypothetical protein